MALIQICQLSSIKYFIRDFAVSFFVITASQLIFSLSFAFALFCNFIMLICFSLLTFTAISPPSLSTPFIARTLIFCRFFVFVAHCFDVCISLSHFCNFVSSSVVCTFLVWSFIDCISPSIFCCALFSLIVCSSLSSLSILILIFSCSIIPHLLALAFLPAHPQMHLHETHDPPPPSPVRCI